MLKKFRSYKSPYRQLSLLLFMVVFASIGAALLFASHAAAPSLTTNPAIAPATNLQAIDTTPSSVLLTWTASTNPNITSYAIYQGSSEVGTTQALTTSFLSSNLSANTAYTYSVYAQINGTNSYSSNLVNATTAASATVITSCGINITSPGNYVLNTSLTYSSNSSACITIQNTNHVSLNCQNNDLSNNLGVILSVNSVNNFLINNCSFIGTTTNGYNSAAAIVNSNNGAVENNSLGNSQSVASKQFLNSQMQGNTDVHFDNNIVYDGSIGSYAGNSDTFNDNIVICALQSTCAAGMLLNGSNNVSAYNNINGEGGAQPGSAGSVGPYGTDDGYDIGSNGVTSSNNIIEYNTLENFYDTGIETIGLNTYDTFSHNIISNATLSGIGGWWWDSWVGNTVNNNVVTNAQNLFYLALEGGVTTGQSQIFFNSNSFTGNSFIPGSYSVIGNEGELKAAEFQFGNLPVSELSATNNLFTDNNFTTTEQSPDIEPQSLAVDGGDNVCGIAQFLPFKCSSLPSPSAPTTLLAGSNGSGGAFLSWSASVDPGGSAIAGYNVFRNGVKLNSTPISVTSYTDPSLSAGSSYAYSVQAVTASGLSSKSSNTASITPTVVTPSVPTNISAHANSPTSATVSWSASTDTGGPGIAGYHILRGGVVIASVSAAVTSYTDSTLKAGTSYSYTIESYDTANTTSAQSVAASVTTPAVVPSTPTNVKAVANSSTTATISWSASTDSGGPGLAGYKILRSVINTGETQQPTIISVGSNVTSYEDSSLTGGVTYSYSVESYDTASNTSPPSLAVVITTPSVIPSTPAGLSASALSATSVKLSWSASTDSGGPGLAGYHILRGGVVIASVTLQSGSPVGGIQTTYTDNTVVASTTYSYSVEAYDKSTIPIVSNPSAAAVVTTPPLANNNPPTAPTNVKATAISASTVTITWSASNDIGGSGLAGYYILRASPGTTYTTLAQIQSVTSYTDSTVSGATTYTYVILAFDTAGNVSAPSLTAVVTTPSVTGQIPAPTQLTATAISSSQVNLTWQESSSSVKSFEVYEKGISLPIATVGTTSYGVTNLRPSTSYSFYIVASVGSVVSSPSTIVSVTTLAPPPPTTTTVYGIVTSAVTHKALPYVHVYTDTKQINAYTNGSGAYVLVNIPPNTKYDYHFSLKGYKTKAYTEKYTVGLHLLNGVLTP